MKKIILFSCIFGICLLSGMHSRAQCTINGLDSIYCLSSPPDTLSGTPAGGMFLGPGMTDSIFDPVAAGIGAHTIYYTDGSTNTYIIDMNGTFSPDTGNGTQIFMSDDDVQGPFLIGFSFSFFGNTYSDFYISSNGFITFNADFDNGCCTGGFLPAAGTPNNLIAFAWEDLNPENGGTIEYFTAGVAPNQRLVVNFINIFHYTGGPVTSQVILYEGSNIIEIHTTDMPQNGGGHTMGIEDAAGSFAYVVTGRNSAVWSASSEYVAFIPGLCDSATVNVIPAPVLNITQSSDSVCKGDNVNLIATGADIINWSPSTWLDTTAGPVAIATPDSSITYTVTGIDTATGCASFPVLITIYVYPPIIVNVQVSDAISPTTCTGTASAVPVSGTPPFSYQWDDPNLQILQTATGLCPGNYNCIVSDASGCSISKPVSIGIVGVDEISFRQSLVIFPNPSDGKFNLMLYQGAPVEKVNIELTNAVGQTLWMYHIEKLQGKFEKQLDFSALPKGIYLLKVHSEEISVVRKVVIH